MPPEEYGTWWSVLLDTADDGTWASDSGDTFGPGDVVAVSPRSTLILRRPLETDATSSLTAAATHDPATPSSARARPRQAPACRRRQRHGAVLAAAPRPVRRGDDEGAQP